MRKVFRMQYEPCNGDCYAWGDDDDDDVKHENTASFSSIRSLKDNLPRLKSLMDRLVKIHEPLCGNANMRYAIDQDTKTGLYVGSFWHYGKLELVMNSTILNTLEDLIEMVLKHITSEAGIAEVAADPGLGHSVCHYGEDQDLRKFVLKAAKIPTPNGPDAFLEQLQTAV